MNPRTLVARVPFVVLVILALGSGLGVTLWLSTDAAERSYQLGNARQVNQALIQQKEALERDVLEAQAAPALAEAARELGMIPSRDTAHLVQDAGGNWVVVGTPKPAEGVSPPPLNVPLADPAPPASLVAEPLEVPVRVSPDTGLPESGMAPGMAPPTVPGLVPGMVPGTVPGMAPEAVLGGPVQAVPGWPEAPVAPLTAGPGVEVPHSAPGRPSTPGPIPSVPSAAIGGGAVPVDGVLGGPLDALPTQLSPDSASQLSAPPGTEPIASMPGAPA